MLVSALITHIRTMLDSDSTETPDAACIMWINEAENRIYQALKTSGAFRSKQTVSSSITSAILAITTITEVTSVIGPNWELAPIAHESALRRWPKNASPTASDRTTGDPVAWSYDDGVLFLWPSPASVQSMTVYGEVAFTPITAVGDTPDFPTPIHPLLAEYAIAKGYVLQQDATMAQLVMARFEGELDILQRQYNRDSLAAKHVLGGARSTVGVGTYGPTMNRLRMPWE